MKQFFVLAMLLGLAACDTVETPPQAVAQAAVGAETLTKSGEHLFANNCSRCHAFQGNAAPDLVGAWSRLSKEDFQKTVTEGRNRMPAHPHLSQAQKDELWSFVSTATQANAAIAKTREGEGCSCGGACGGGGGHAGHGGGRGAVGGAAVPPNQLKDGTGPHGQGGHEGCGGACAGGGNEAGGGGCGCGKHGG